MAVSKIELIKTGLTLESATVIRVRELTHCSQSHVTKLSVAARLKLRVRLPSDVVVESLK